MRALALAVLPLMGIMLAAADDVGPINRRAGSVIIFGNSQAKACSDSAELVADNKMSPAYAVEVCTEALNLEALSTHERAATYNNRGVIRLGMVDEQPFARGDFDAASRLEPDLGTSYVNRGASLVLEERYEEALVEFDKGIALDPDQPWRAYFNRAIARENLGDIRGAYNDYMKSVELKPDWEPAITELARFQVRTRAAN